MAFPRHVGGSAPVNAEVGRPGTSGPGWIPLYLTAHFQHISNNTDKHYKIWANSTSSAGTVPLTPGWSGIRPRDVGTRHVSRDYATLPGSNSPPATNRRLVRRGEVPLQPAQGPGEDLLGDAADELDEIEPGASDQSVWRLSGVWSMRAR